jgi:hypothetical protein
MDARRGWRRDAGLLAVTFVAILILLAGLAIGVGVGGRTTGGGRPAMTPSIAGSVSPRSPIASATPSPSGDVAPDPVLVGAGDIASCDTDDDEATARLIDGIAGTVFTAGDNAYEDGTLEQFRDCYGPTWGRFLGRTRAAVGNHDWQTKDAAGYRAYFGAAATGAEGRTWYSYELGTWHVIVLDSDCADVGGCGPDSEQGRWLAADLATSSARCTLTIWHHPRFSSGSEHGDDARVAPFWDRLYAAGVDVVVNGHDHDYERFGPQNPAGQEDRERGIREFVVGTGGVGFRPFARTARPNSELRIAGYPGVIRFVLHKAGYDWTWLPTAADFSDTGTASCH